MSYTERDSVQPISSKFVLLIAVACGLSAGSAYFNQPLIYSIALSLNVTPSQAGLSVVLAQVGYGLGLMLLVPLGDLFNKRNLIVSLMIFASLCQIFLSFSPNITVFYILTMCVTFTAISAQILIPFASSISPQESSATIVGKLMSGLVMGIILSRTFAGFVSTYWSWQGVYLISSVVTLLFAMLMWKKLPSSQPSTGLAIVQIYRSMFQITLQYPNLIRLALSSALGFSILSLILTSMTYVLRHQPYHFSDFQIGLFGILGVIGIFSSSWSGKKVSAGKEKLVGNLCLSLLLLCCVPLYFAQHNIWIYSFGVLMAYFGLTAFHVLNQNLVYQIDLKSRSRINAVYMVIYYSGGALGSLTAVYAWQHWQWLGCVSLVLLFALGVLVLDRVNFRKIVKAKE